MRYVTTRRAGWVLLLWLAAPVHADETCPRSDALLRATGEAHVVLPPDRATLTLAVETEASDAAAATRNNATRAQAVLKAVRASGSVLTLKTLGYSLEPVYVNDDKPRSVPQIRGYTARNRVEIRTVDLPALGAILDAALKAGANRVDGLEFGLQNEDAARIQALERATANARAKLDAMARAAKLTIARVRSVEEQGSNYVPVMARMAMMGDAKEAATPVEGGDIEVRASVLMVVDLAP